MANENPSRENPSRQQTAERSQTGTSQQGTGAAQQGGAAYQGGGAYQGNYGQGTHGQGSQGQRAYGQGGGQGSSGRYGQGNQGRGNYGPGVGKSTWQGGRQSGGALAPRGGSASSPYYGSSSGYGSGPFSVMRRISDEMDRLFENFGMGRGLFQSEPGPREQWEAGNFGEGAPSMWSPHIEVCERNGKLLIQADLPGMKRDDINVRVEDDEVIIQGERRQEQSSNERGYYRSERSYGSFYRTIPLPEGTNAESANATFKDGVLEIELDAPRQQQRGRTLEIRDAGGSPSGSHSGTASGTTYGSGTTGSMQGTSGTSGGQHLQSGTGATQHSSGGASGTQHSSAGGSGTMYSGSGNPSVGSAGMGGATPGSSSDKSSRGSNT
jgi:HSP20 family protein